MRNKAIAYLLGITCHISFGASVCVMAYMLFFGMTKSIVSLDSLGGRWLDLLLLIQFPILHSLFLTTPGRKVLVSPFPKEISRDLFSTAYCLFASFQLLAGFLFWVPNTEVWFHPSGVTYVVWTIVYAFSWIILLVALNEAGMAMHTGLLGWRAVAQGVKPQYPKLPKKGLHSICRHPIYLAFALIILTAPTWSFDHFYISLIWVTYCVIGPVFKEQRLRKIFGEEYKLLQERTPYIVPALFTSVARFKNR